ncbi:MAG TPA: hypothetical protein VKU82_13615 [Planctomycetaceae bacterium]|nr:hypothetical protein [Planctomycetaceae bacterium]
MNVTSEQFELIVKRVLERLETNGSPPSSASGPASASAAEVQNPKVPEVRIEQTVITQALLSETTTGAAQVRIGPKAILTPSARDFVHHRGITIVRESSQKVATALRFLLIATASTPQVSAAVDDLQRLGITCEVRLSGLPGEAAVQAISALCRGEANRIVVVTDQPEVLACLSNRNDRVRAAAVSGTAAVARVKRTLNANLLAIDTSGIGAHELTSLLKAFLST